MKRHLNTLFVTTQDTWLSKDGECVELRLEGRTLGRIPLHTLQSIACFGRISCSQYLLEHCARLGITVTWFTEYGRFMASMHGPTTGNVLLRRAQYRLADSLRKSAAERCSFVRPDRRKSRRCQRRQKYWDAVCGVWKKDRSLMSCAALRARRLAVISGCLISLSDGNPGRPVCVSMSGASGLL